MDFYKIFDKRKRVQLLLFSFIPAMVVSLTLFVYAKKASASIEENYAITLNEIISQQKHSVDGIFESHLGALKNFASFFTEESFSFDPEHLMNVLSVFEKNSNFDMTFYADANGKSLASNGKYYIVSEMAFFKEAMSGVVTCKALENCYDVSGSFFVFAVPVFDKENNVIGVLAGSYLTNDVNNLIKPSFSDNGYAFIVSPDDQIICHSANSSVNALERELADACLEQEGRIHKYTYNGIVRYVSFTKLNINDWYLVLIAPEKALETQLMPLVQSASYASVINFVIFVLMFVVMLILQEVHTKEISKLAYTDPVTKGISLQKFYSDVKAFLTLNKSDSVVAICFDIDDFRVINDLYGLDEGNDILKNIYEKMKEEVADDGFVCRAANDMFYVLYRTSEKEDGLSARFKNFAEKINASLEKRGKHYRITLTVGFYFVEQNYANPYSIFERANHVHNRAKKKSIHSAVYQEKYRETMIKHKMIENSMRNAFQNLEFHLFLQPKYELLNKTLIGAEALIRWNSPHTGRQYPDEFIPVFEKTGFITQVDLFMIEKTCQILRDWIDRGIPPVPISVNQSKLLLLNPLYFNVLTSTIEKYSISPNLIEIEITETIMYENTDILNDLINKLHDYGIRISIDDFGSGYSSLVLLRDIKADVLKIDKEFIYKAEHNLTGRKILSSIIQLADSLDMAILAEGIETTEQADLLTYLGCHEAQGYLFGRPSTIEEFEEKKLGA